MRRRSSLVAVLFLMTLVVGAPVLRSADATEDQACHGSVAGADQMANAKVILQDIQYKPTEIDLPAVGQSACWEHDDGQTPHTVTFDATPTVKNPPDSNPDCDSQSDGSKCFRQSDATGFKVVFQSAGTFTYHCKVHSTMKGVVKVAGGGAPVGTTTTRATTATTTSTNTTVGTLSGETTTTTLSETTTSEGPTTSTTIGFATATTAPGTAASKSSNDDNDPSGVLKAIAVLLLAASTAALIPSWRRLT